MSKVVIVLISGLGSDASQLINMPILEQLSQAGANTVIQSIPPTYSQTARMTIVSGAYAELNGAPPIDQLPDNISISPADTIFARAHEFRRETALLGKDDWRYLVPDKYLDHTFYMNGSGPEADQAILQAALPILDNEAVDLLLLQFTGLEFAARRQGGPPGNAFQIAAADIDNYIGQISKTLDFNQTVLMILGDHGFTASGGHGGDETEIIQQPLIIVGEKIIPGNYSNVHQVDIAPTVSTWLGIPTPASAQGRILFEMFNLSAKDQTAAQLALTQQRIKLAETYLTQVAGSDTTLPQVLFTDLERGKTAFSQNNLRGAFQLALLTQEQADNQISSVKHSRIRSAQRFRLLVVVIIILCWLTIMWRRRGKYMGIIFIAVLVTISLYHILYQLQGHSYSISSFNDFTQLPLDIARRTVVSLLAGGALILVFLMLSNEENWIVLLGAGYGFSILVTFGFALPLFWAFWQNGFTISWYLPSVGPVFWQVVSLLEIAIVTILGLLLPWPIMLLNILVYWARRNLSDSPTQSKSDVLPGLRL